MLAFDATYLTSTLTQMQLNNVRGMVGGIWSPDQPSNAFLPLDDELDFNKVVKAASVLEMLVWDPTMKKKIPLPICEVPLQHNFSGTGASHRGNWYMAGLVGSGHGKVQQPDQRCSVRQPWNPWLHPQAAARPS